VSFAAASVETLTAIRANLLIGLDAVAATIEAGTFHICGTKGEAPPSQSGHFTLMLLRAVDAELAERS
jgi:hypothetical protein